MNLRRILNALSEQTDPIMDIPGETFTSGPFEGQPKVAGKLDILRDNEPYVGEVDGDDMFPIDEDGDGQLDLPGEPCPPGSPCAEEHCPDSPSGCNVDSSGNVYTLQEVPIPGTPPPGTWLVLVLTTPDGEQYAYTGANPAYPDGGGWFLITTFCSFSNCLLIVNLLIAHPSNPFIKLSPSVPGSPLPPVLVVTHCSLSASL